MNKRLKSLLRSLLPHNIRKHRILTGPLQGYKIITSWHDYPAAIMGRTECPLLEWFSQNVKPGETWLDVGAHYGYTAIALCRLVGEEGRVFAFEPMISTAGYVTQTRRWNGFHHLTVLPFGLAAPATLEVKQLSVTRGMVDSTLKRDEGHTVWQETIMVAQFNWLWSRICGGNERIDGVKIDVQGMEIEVMQGMIETLRQQKPKLVIEVHHGVNRMELLGLIDAAGYSRQSKPIEPIQGEVEAKYIDDRSYVFQAIP